MAATMEDLERRVIALEKAQSENASTLRWVAGTLGQIQAVQDEHTQRLGRLETKFEGVEGKVDGLRGKVDGLIQALPTIVGDAVRDAMKPNGRS